MIADPFVLLVPVKLLSTAKSRLGLDAAASRRLMAAFTRDAVAAARRSRLVAHVYLVSEERELAAELGVERLPDGGDGDLNRALAAAATRAREIHPGLGVAAMCADLPCLVDTDLTTALAFDGDPRWCVADAEGTGTTLLVCAPGVELRPSFGPGSARAHVDSGATALEDPLRTLRRDVDTPADLQLAVSLGVGPHTEEAVAALRVA